ncbi:GNAT family N-acetyltransferase [bacterium]|nr:GNAT family N-acetyltransferase [bacterium]
MEKNNSLQQLKLKYKEKFIPVDQVFQKIHLGDRIFISTACGEPQYLVNSLVKYVENNPKALLDSEVMHVWTLGVAPYANEKYKRNFRYNSFFIGTNARAAINAGLADYSPIFLSQIPGLFRKGMVSLDVALIQTSLPDEHGFVSLGVSVDIVKAATEIAGTVIAQINKNMPRVHGDGFIHISELDYIVHYDEPLLEYQDESDDEVAAQIGKYVAKLVEDGDTIQVGYGSIPNAVLASLVNKKNLGIHTELISDGLVELMKKGVVNNSKKTVNRGKTVATFCMGNKSTYEYINDNPAIEFKTVDFTNNPLTIARHKNMTAINSALEIDLTGQASAESLGHIFYSGIGGQADFMRGAILAEHGKTILTIPSTADNGKVSRIMPFLKEGAGVTLNRGDIHYVVTEYGIAYLHGKNIRERAMELIAIAHPKFRPELIKEAKERNLIYKDQAFIAGKNGEYPSDLETHRVTKTGFSIFLRPIKISDEPLLKEFFYSLSDNSMYKRFISTRKDMPHERLQDFSVIDYRKEMYLLATDFEFEHEMILGLGQYWIDENTHTAEIAFIVLDNYHRNGIGEELLTYLTLLAKKQGLLGFTAEVLVENIPMQNLFKKAGFDI